MAIEGKAVTIGEREFLVPKLRVGTLRRVTGIIAEIDGIDPATKDAGQAVRWFDAHVRGILELLRRNYPELAQSEVEDLIDADAIVSVFLAVMAAAGRKVDDKGEAVSP